MPSGSEVVASFSAERVISYARISFDRARDEHGVADQHKVNRATADRLGWQVVREITDNDRSASKADVVREGFEEMLKILKAGRLPDGTRVTGVVVVVDDRLVRRAGDYERFVDALTAEDGRVYADARGPKDLYSEDVEGMGLVGVAFAKIEARKIRRRSHRARAEAGRPVGLCDRAAVERGRSTDVAGQPVDAAGVQDGVDQPADVRLAQAQRRDRHRLLGPAGRGSMGDDRLAGGVAGGRGDPDGSAQPDGGVGRDDR